LTGPFVLVRLDPTRIFVEIIENIQFFVRHFSPRISAFQNGISSEWVWLPQPAVPCSRLNLQISLAKWLLSSGDVAWIISTAASTGI
jgi:hypothetical protein